MHTREVTISVCAAILGVIVGSAALNYGTVAVDAAVIPIRTIEPGKEARARHVKGVPSEQINPVRTPAMLAPKKDEGPVTACQGVRAALKDVAAAEAAAIPNNIENTELIASLAKARADIETKYCAAEDAAAAAEMSSSSVSSTKTINVDTSACKKYPEGTMRYNFCLIRLQGRVN